MCRSLLPKMTFVQKEIIVIPIKHERTREECGIRGIAGIAKTVIRKENSGDEKARATKIIAPTDMSTALSGSTKPRTATKIPKLIGTTQSSTDGVRAVSDERPGRLKQRISKNRAFVSE